MKSPIVNSFRYKEFSVATISNMSLFFSLLVLHYVSFKTRQDFLACFSQKTQESPQVIADLTGLGSIPEPINKTRRFNTPIGQVLCSLHFRS